MAPDVGLQHAPPSAAALLCVALLLPTGASGACRTLADLEGSWCYHFWHPVERK